MSDRYLSPVGPSDTDLAGRLQKVDQYARVKSSEARPRGDPEPRSATIQGSAGHTQVTKPANVHLQFKIDPATNDITVIVMDRESEQVIRTIPPEELSDLVEGDLFEALT